MDTASQIREGLSREPRDGGTQEGRIQEVPEESSSQGIEDERQLRALHLSAAFPDRACSVFTKSCTSSKRHVA